MAFLGIEQYLLEFMTIWYIYQDLTQRKLKKYYFPFLLLISVVLVLLIPVNTFLPLWITVLILSLLEKERRTLCKHLFYSALPVILVDLILKIFNLFIFSMLYKYHFIYEPISIWQMFIVFILILSVNRMLKRLFRIDYPSILHNSDKKVQYYIYGMNGLFLCYYIANYVLIANFENISDRYEKIVTVVSVFVLIYMLTLLNHKVLERFHENMIFEQEEYLHNLENYSQHLEGIYQNIRILKHDYENILISLKESIHYGDIDEISLVYDDIVEKSYRKMSNDDYLFYQLLPLKHNALKMMLVKELLEAKKAGIYVLVAIMDPCDEVALLHHDYVGIIQKLLRSAIARAKCSNEPNLKLVIDSKNSEYRVKIDYSISIGSDISSELSFNTRNVADNKGNLISDKDGKTFVTDPRITFTSENDGLRIYDELIIDGLKE